MIKIILATIGIALAAPVQPVSLPTGTEPVAPIVERLDQVTSDIELLAYTVQQEVGGLHNEKATAAVVNVIYNRGDNLWEILTPDQFNGATNYVTRQHPPDELTWRVILHREQYRGITNGAKYFCSYDDLNGDAKNWFDGLEMTLQIGSMRFYRG